MRSYNAAWDYYKGMSPGEIELQLRADAAWQRPTWPLGRLGGGSQDEAAFRDPLDLLSAGRFRPPPRPDMTGALRRDMPTALREPLATLGLDWPVTLDEVKARYKELAKRHHPDANGGDRRAEERLKTINLAYATLRRGLADDPGLAATG